MLPADSRLISGDYYAEPSLANTTGHPYFMDPLWKKGYVVLEAIRYENLWLRYNIASNQLLLNLKELTGTGIQISLKKQNISEFGLDGHRFIPDHSGDGKPTGRFRELLADGPAKLEVLWTKSLKVPASGTSVYVYESRNQWMLVRGDVTVPYHGIRTLIKLYPSISQDLISFKRTLSRTIRRDRRLRETALVNQCNSLTGGKQ
jgi:hypothetical protein